MSSTMRRQTGFEVERPAGQRDYCSPRRYASQADDVQSELSYISAFEALDLNGLGNRAGRYPRASSSSDYRGSPGRAYHSVSPRGEIHPVPTHVPTHVPTTSPQRGIAAPNSLGLAHRSPSLTTGVEVYHGPSSRPGPESFEDSLIYQGYSPRNERDARRSGWGSSSSFAPPRERVSRGYDYPRERSFMDRRGPEMPIECHCRTCTEHRRAVRHWLHPFYEGRGMPLQQNYRTRHDYHRDTYPASSYSRSRGRYPEEEYFTNSLNNGSDPSSYSSWPEDAYYPYRNASNSRRPGARINDFEDLYYESDEFDCDYDSCGSDHEYSDGASYTGYERYEDYGDDGRGHYEDEGGYSD